jgi:beta-glucosidase
MHVVATITTLLVLVGCAAAAVKKDESEVIVQSWISQMGQYDICDFIVEDDPVEPKGLGYGYWINETKLEGFVHRQQIGSLFNSPSAGPNKLNVPPVAWWRKVQQRIFEISSTGGNHIPILFGLDSVHGANYIFGATLFPQQIGVAATFDVGSATAVGNITAIESRYAGIPWTFAPILGIAVQPSWPRVYETYGEDPHLVKKMGVHVIRALQQPPPASMGLNGVEHAVAACMKHFIGFGNSRTGRNLTPAWIPMNILLQYFAPPFQAAIEAGVLSAMENEIEVNGRPVVASELLLSFVLRNRLMFEGMLVTDYNEIYNLKDFHHAAKDYIDAVRLSLSATTIDMAMQSYPTTDKHDPQYKPIMPELIETLWRAGKLDAPRFAKSATRVFALKKKLGIDVQTPVPAPKAGQVGGAGDDHANCLFGCKSHHAAALDVTRKSMTLLKNVPALTPPLERSAFMKIAVIGQACNSVPLMAGGWSIHWQGTTNKSAFPYGSTVFEEVQRISTNATFSTGCSSLADGSTCDPTVQQAAVDAARAAEVAVVCVGEAPYAEINGDIYDMAMPGGQIAMVAAIRKVAKQVVVVLVQGRPRLLGSIVDNADTILHAYLPGPFGGAAIVETLTGTNNPSGRLPISYPMHPSDAPQQYWHKYSADLYGDWSVQWPFGHGLSYTSFEYSTLMSHFSIDIGIVASVTVKNTGTRTGADAVLMYVTQPTRVITPEVRMLKDFQRVVLKPGQSVTVNFNASIPDLGYYDEFNCKYLEASPFTTIVGELTAGVTITVPGDLSHVPIEGCSPWGQFVEAHTTVMGVLTSSPSKISGSTGGAAAASSTARYFMSSVVCFGAGIIGTIIIVAFIRKRGQMNQQHVQLLEPSGV